MIGTAIAGPSSWFRKSEVDSPIAVVRIFTTQNSAVISGTLASARRAGSVAVVILDRDREGSFGIAKDGPAREDSHDFG